ncbi:hypothetical protein [Maricaulis sp. CAU 1757]
MSAFSLLLTVASGDTVSPSGSAMRVVFPDAGGKDTELSAQMCAAVAAEWRSRGLGARGPDEAVGEHRSGDILIEVAGGPRRAVTARMVEVGPQGTRRTLVDELTSVTMDAPTIEPTIRQLARSLADVLMDRTGEDRTAGQGTGSKP